MTNQNSLSDAEKQLKNLGNSIRLQRKKLKVSATAAAESASLSRVTWHRLEKGEPSVSAGAYFAALAVLGLSLPYPQTEQANTQIKDYLPLQIKLSDFPQLKFLAWQLQKVEFLTPKEAWDIYQRNWRHVEEEQLEDDESRLIQQLKTVFEG